MESIYRPRLVDALVAELIAEVPAVSLIGPRASGKTTTARQYAASVIHLDQPGVAEVFRTDPDAALRGLAEPVLFRCTHLSALGIAQTSQTCASAAGPRLAVPRRRPPPAQPRQWVVGRRNRAQPSCQTPLLR